MTKREKIILDVLIKTRLEILNIFIGDKNSDKYVSQRTRIAQSITKKWQGEVAKHDDFFNKNTLKIEDEVSKDNNEKIDLVDLKEKTAYELKVSGKNCHHEFYKDLIKVITYNLNPDGEKLKKLIFISEGFGIEKLKGRLDKKLIYEIKCKHDITIELISI